LGNGLTGSSNNAWVQASADLSAYAGKSVQVRFMTATDDSVDRQGMAIAHVSIPQLSFSDDGTSDNGWDAKGWLRNNNVLPETYTVQAALFGSDGSLMKVVPVPVGADGTGALDIAH